MADGPRPCHVADHGSPWTHRLHCHVTPPADSPRLTRGRSASASPLRVMHAEYGRHVPPSGPLVSPSSPPPQHPFALSLSLPPTLPKHPRSLAKPWRSSPSSTLTIEAPPRRSTTGGRRRTTPTSCTTPISSSSLGRSFPPTSSSSTPSPPSSPKQGRRPRATPSLPRQLEALAGILLDAGECFPSPIHPPLS